MKLFYSIVGWLNYLVVCCVLGVLFLLSQLNKAELYDFIMLYVCFVLLFTMAIIVFKFGEFVYLCYSICKYDKEIERKHTPLEEFEQ